MGRDGGYYKVVECLNQVLAAKKSAAASLAWLNGRVSVQ